MKQTVIEYVVPFIIFLILTLICYGVFAKPIDQFNLGAEVSIPWYLNLKVGGEYIIKPKEDEIKIDTSILVPVSEISNLKFTVKHEIKKSGFANTLGVKLYTAF